MPRKASTSAKAAKAKPAKSARKPTARKTAAKGGRAKKSRTAQKTPLVTMDESDGLQDGPLVTLEGENGHDDEIPMVTLASEDELVAEDGEAEEGDGWKAPSSQVQATPIHLEMPLNTEWSLPEQFLAVALNEDWDERMEKAKAGRQGAALAASLLLELALRERLRLHLDRFQVVGEPTGDPALDAFAQEVESMADRKAPEALERLGNKAGQHVDPWRGRLHRRGVAQMQRWRWLGIFPRSRTIITDPEAKQKLENRLQRTLVGGTPDVRTILLLGLIDAAGLLREIIPEGAIAYNRKRIQALLAGRDPLGYRVDPHIHDLQGALVGQLLRDVRRLQGNRE